MQQVVVNHQRGLLITTSGKGTITSIGISKQCHIPKNIYSRNYHMISSCKYTGVVQEVIDIFVQEKQCHTRVRASHDILYISNSAILDVQS